MPLRELVAAPTPLVLTEGAQAIPALLTLFRQHHRFLVTSHARPDGDALGSALGALHLLEGLGKQVSVAFADPIPRPFQRLPGAERITRTLPAGPFDVVLVLECDSVPRTGFPVLPAGLLINVDHHHSGHAYGDVNWIDAAVPAVGVLVYDLAVASGIPLTAALASCLYAAVLTDTVSFTLPSTTARTFDLARHLLELGADAAGISDAVYFSQRESKLRLLARSLDRMVVQCPIAWSAVTHDDMAATGAGIEDTEGIVQMLIGMENIHAAALLRELPGGDELRVSLRSKGVVNVARVAELFGGGGHRNASGCSLPGPLHLAEQQLQAALLAACQEVQGAE